MTRRERLARRRQKRERTRRRARALARDTREQIADYFNPFPWL